MREEYSESAAAVRKVLEDVLANYHVDPTRIVAHGRKEFELPPVDVEEGEQILFVNDNNGTLPSDNFDWQWQITQLQADDSVVRVWDSVLGFHGPLKEGFPVDRSILKQALTDLCHVLLSSNEFSYID